MTARTHTYVRLKELYAARAKSDRDAIAARVRALLKAHGMRGVILVSAAAASPRRAGRRESDIPDGEIDYFVRNVRGISCVIVRSLAEEHDPKRFRVEDVNEAFEEYEEPREDLRPKDLYWYFGLRAVMRFKAQRGRFPGVDGERDRRAGQRGARAHHNRGRAQTRWWRRTRTRSRPSRATSSARTACARR
jgi:hypothetical protein